MSDPAVRRNRFWLAAALTLTALKLWLTRGQGLFAIGGAGHDDRLFLQLAEHLVRGEWLGLNAWTSNARYDEITVFKL